MDNDYDFLVDDCRDIINRIEGLDIPDSDMEPHCDEAVQALRALKEKAEARA